MFIVVVLTSYFVATYFVSFLCLKEMAKTEVSCVDAKCFFYIWLASPFLFWFPLMIFLKEYNFSHRMGYKMFYPKVKK